ncbi:hypothetical protein BC830DRAFT_1110500 [Chytriomyces sp. MP71]|nr:hypothetical protein BC830DRAFT_1110500 [Chytriomyces sp. MP71]
MVEKRYLGLWSCCFQSLVGAQMGRDSFIACIQIRATLHGVLETVYVLLWWARDAAPKSCDPQFYVVVQFSGVVKLFAHDFAPTIKGHEYEPFKKYPKSNNFKMPALSNYSAATTSTKMAEAKAKGKAILAVANLLVKVTLDDAKSKVTKPIDSGCR